MMTGDFADQATAETEATLTLLLMEQRSTRAPSLPPKGSCYNCREPFFSAGGVALAPQADKKLFCDSDCCEDYETSQRQARRV